MEQEGIIIQENGYDMSVAAVHSLQEECYKLRHDVFYDELGWVHENRDRLEIDQFDSFSKNVVISNKGRVNAYLRITPADKPWLLKESFSFLIDEEANQNFYESSIEVTRFAIDAESRNRKLSGRYTILDLMIKGLIKLSVENQVKHWYVVLTKEVSILFRRRGLNCHPLGKTVVMPDGVKTLAARIDVEEFITNCQGYYLSDVALT